MDKGRAIITYTMAKRRTKAGSPELLDHKHQYWEAVDLIDKNNWNKEAYEYSRRDDKICREKIKSFEDELYNLLLSGEDDKEKEQYLIDRLNEYDISGEVEETIKYKASHNGEEPTYEELREILKKREAEDMENAKKFLHIHALIALGEDFDKDELIEVTKKVRNHGLYQKLLYQIYTEVNTELFRRYNPESPRADFEPILYC